jgi:predicted transcriptional regulator
MPDVEQTDLTALTVQLLSAYVSNNTVPSEQLASLIETTRSALGGKTEPEPESAPEFQPAVTVRKSLGSKDHILSLIDGKAYKTLKRHLKNHGLTPAEYRERYGLPKGYPMVAPAYSEARREVAYRLGLGQRGAARRAEIAAEAAGAAAPIEPVASAPTKKPRVVKAKAAPKRSTKPARTATVEAVPVTEAPAQVAPVVETPAKTPRGRKPIAAARPEAAKPAKAKRARAQAAPTESAPAVEAPAPGDAPAPKARGRKPKEEAAPAAAKRARKSPAVEPAPPEVVASKPKRARTLKTSEPTA